MIEKARKSRSKVAKKWSPDPSMTLNADLLHYPDRDRSWSRTINPKTALDQFLTETQRFVKDEYLNTKVLFTYIPQGFLRCIADSFTVTV